MRVLIPSAGSHGDVLPFVAIGREMQARGHEVILYGNPYFREYVAAVGIQFVPVSTTFEYEKLFGELAESDPRKALQRVTAHFGEICGAYYEAMKADAVSGHTITVSNSLLFAPRLLREIDGIPCAAVHLSPCVIRSSIRPARLAPNWIGVGTPALMKQMAWWFADKFVYDPYFTRPLNKLRAKFGLPPLERIFRTWIHEADSVVAMFPDWFAERQVDWPSEVVLAGFPFYDHGAQVPLTHELSQFIEAGPAPVAFSAGTANANAQEFFEASAEACRIAGIRAIFLSHFAGQIPKHLPDSVVHAKYAPFGALLPKLAAFVHHGGIGSTSQALRAGVPQLIRPVAYDQFDNSARAVQLGVARELLPKHYSARTAAAALSQLTSDVKLRERCKEIAERLVQSNSVKTACDVIISRYVERDAQPIVPGDGLQAALAGTLRASPSAGP